MLRENDEIHVAMMTRVRQMNGLDIVERKKNQHELQEVPDGNVIEGKFFSESREKIHRLHTTMTLRMDGIFFMREIFENGVFCIISVWSLVEHPINHMGHPQ